MIESTVQVQQAYSSITLTKNTKGYQWEIKVYTPIGEEDQIIPLIDELDKTLRDKYGEEV